MEQPQSLVTASPQPILIPALKVGAATGCSGLLAGGVISILRSSPTVGLFALGTGFNCFALGTTYMGLRGTMFRLRADPSSSIPTAITPKEKVYISGLSGALTGLSVGLVLRGRSNAIPGAIVWGLLGLGGQYTYNKLDERHTQEVVELEANPPKVSDSQESFLDRAFRSKWNPVKKLTQDEYLDILNSKALALDAQIAITQDEIDRLKAVSSKEESK